MSPKVTSSKRGFALVVALSLMAFILLLMISLSAVVRVESQSSNINKSTVLARQNALLGLQVALGQLQKYTGADQRITASSDLFFDSSSPLNNPTSANGEEVNQRHWTGVWKKGDDILNTSGAAVGKEPQQLIWLVSGNEGVSFDGDDKPNLGAVPSASNSGGIATDHVWMVDFEGSFTDDTDRVQVPTVAIRGNQNSNTGKYAFWISDENTKAKVNTANALDDPNASNSGDYSPGSPKRQFLDLISAQKVTASAVSNTTPDQSGGVGGGFQSTIFPTEPSYEEKQRLWGVEDIVLLSDIPETEISDYFHSVTTSSQSLLTNVKDGGFRSDLTNAFATNQQFASFLSEHGTGYGVAGYVPSKRAVFDSATTNGLSPSLDNPGGPLWDQLRTYWEFGESSQTTRDLTTQTDTRMGLYPVIANFQMPITGTWYEIPTTVPDSPEWSGRIYFMPSVTFWNPYNITINVPRTWLRLTTDRAFNGSGFHWDMYAFIHFHEHDRAGWYKSNLAHWNNDNPPIGTFRPALGSNQIYPLTFQLEEFTIGPGEAVVLSPKQNRSLAPASNPDNNILSPGWRVHAFYLNPQDPYYEGRTPITSRTNFYLGQANFDKEPKSVRFGIENGDGTPVRNFNIEWAKERDSLVNVVPSVTSSYNTDDNIIQKLQYLPAGNIQNTDGRYDSFGLVPVFKAAHCAKEPNGVLPPDPNMDLGYIFDYGDPPVQYEFNIKYSNNPSNYSYWAPQYEKGGYVRWLTHHNHRAAFQGKSPVEISTASSGALPNFYYGNAGNSSILEPSLSDPGTGAVETGIFEGIVGKERTVLFNIPQQRAPILSIGQLGHANLSRTHHWDADADLLSMSGGHNGVESYRWASRSRYLFANYTPAYPIGNSLADLRIPNTHTYVNWNGSNIFHHAQHNSTNTSGFHYDYSYHLNEALWDGHFFSGIPASGNLDNTTVLPNSRYEINEEASSSSLREWDESASHLTLNGGFNINSTSFEAWKAVLTSALGSEVPTSTGTSDSTGLVPFPRQFPAIKGAFKERDGSTDNESDEAYAGFRSLTPYEIDLLARNIVDTMKTRRSAIGPFLSLANFVNRDPSATREDSRITGLLQEAIDPVDGADTRNLNSDFRNSDSWHFGDGGGGQFSFDTTSAYYNLSKFLRLDSSDPTYGTGTEPNLQGPMAEGINGYFTQADILTRLGPVITARGDTFKIRAYGEFNNPVTGDTQAGVWCEAIVQRLPEFIDSSDPAETKISDLNQINQDFGRRYKILSVRWLSPEEV